jgi:tetratricopeptide (TPR) repeat protein
MCELGNCYNLTENDRDALSFYRKALKINKDCCDAWYGMGKIYYRQGKFKQCVSSLKKATVIQPGNADYWNILGKALKALKKIDEAIHAYSKAAELNPLDLETYMACAHLLFRKKRYEEATSLLVRILKFYHDHPVVIYALAATYTYKGDIHNAMIYFKKGISVDFQAHKEMFKHFPKTRQCQAFQHMVENHPGNK